MIRRLLAITALIALPASASAATVNAGGRVGTFDASGSGSLTMQGKITAFGKVAGSLTVRDPSGTAVVKLNGVRQKPRIVGSGSAMVRVYTASSRTTRAFYVAGPNVRVALVAPRPGSLSISMFGKARVLRLSGIGTYSLNSGAETSWSAAVGAIPVVPAPPTKPTPPARGPKSLNDLTTPSLAPSEGEAPTPTPTGPTAPPPTPTTNPGATPEVPAPAADRVPTLPNAVADHQPDLPPPATDRVPPLPIVAGQGGPPSPSATP